MIADLLELAVDVAEGQGGAVLLGGEIIASLGSGEGGISLPIGEAGELRVHGAAPGCERRLAAIARQMAASVELRQVTEVKATILASLTDGVMTVGADGIVTFCNLAAARAFDRQPDEMLGRRLADILAGNVNAWLLEILDEVVATGEAKQLPMAELETEASGWLSVNITAAPLVAGQGASRGQMLLFEDVTREQTYRRTMSRYVHDTVVDTLVSGERKTGRQMASVLFSDIRSFTSLTESVGAEETVRMLNEYFSYMEDVVTNRRGMVDKYIGDALMALFGAPNVSDQDADNAVTAAVDMFQVLRMFNQRRADDPIRIGIGIATGQVITGDIGSSKRLDFTAIGNPVNLASRLESLTKFYGADIMVCGDTLASLKRPFRQRKVDFIRVRGQSSPTSIHEIVDHRRPDELPPNMDDLFGLYGDALETYLAGDWDKAAGMFETCLRIDPADQASKVMEARCRQLLASPPAKWERVWTYR